MTTRRRRVPRSRLALGALGMVALLAGLWAALLLLGVDVPSPRPDFAEVHGPLMVLGFLGTLVALERAVAIGAPAGYLAPAFSGLGGLALAVGLPLPVGRVLLLLGGLGLVGLYVEAWRRQGSLHLGVMASGAVAWVLAAAVWLTGRDVAQLVPLLVGFLVLTIAGERLELSRVVRLSDRARSSFAAAATLLGAGLVLSIAHPGWGVHLTGAGLLALAAWLAVHDAARRTVRQRGLTRYMAVCLLAGYAWLAVAGALWLGLGTLDDGPAFDAMLHAVLLGFVFGMVMAHAPVIVPAVFRTPVPYRPHFYAQVVLLHASLLVRLVCGDLYGDRLAWQVGGVLNEVALLCFVGVTATAVLQGRRRQRTGPDPVPAPAPQPAAALARGTRP